MHGGMARPARRLKTLCLAAALFVAGTHARADVGEPTLNGEAAGRLQIDALPDLGLEWRIATTGGGWSLRALRPGVELEVALRPDGTGGWRWKITRGALDVAELWPAARERLGEAAAGWSASGRVELAGEGVWSAEGTTGELRAALRDGWARSDALQVEASGVELDLRTNEPGVFALPQGQALRVARVSAGGVETKNVRVVFGVNQGRRVDVTVADAEVLGGLVRLRPFAFSAAEPAVSAAAEVAGVSLAEVAKLLPWAVSAAEGRLRGRVRLDWDAARGLKIADGGLSIARADGAELRLAPAPGFLTGSMTPRFAFLPRSWGRWTERVGPVNPAYAPLRAIEMGQVGLRVETLEVDFRPDGTREGRSATIRVLARPTRAELVESVALEVNFHGPLSEALALGLSDRARLRLR